MLNPALMQWLEHNAQALDAGRVVVTSGVSSGDRVVVEGAGLLAQVK